MERVDYGLVDLALVVQLEFQLFLYRLHLVKLFPIVLVRGLPRRGTASDVEVPGKIRNAIIWPNAAYRHS